MMDLMRFIEEKVSGIWKNLSFLGRTRKRVQVPKVGTNTHCAEGIWYWYPFTSRGLVPVPIKVVPIPMLPATLFLYPLHC